MNEHVRQGDILLVRVEEAKLPEGLKPVEREDGKVVLAYGEATGHHHAIAEPGAELLEGADLDERFLRVLEEGGVALTHQEHSTITLLPGDYRVVRQREYAPEAPRYVAD